MKELYLADFLLLKEVVNQELLDNCISSLEKHNTEPTVETLFKYNQDFYELCYELEKQDRNDVHFDNFLHLYETMTLFVEMMVDVFNTGTKFFIKKNYSFRK